MPYDHVILVSVDTLRADLFAAYPRDTLDRKYGVRCRLGAANLDRLLAGGAFFPNTLTAAPYTSTAHASFFTGLWPLHHGLYEFFNRSLDAPTLFTAARQAGHRTNFKTDFPIILGPYLGFTRDVDSYRIEDDDGFLADLAASEKSLSFVHFGGAHLPYGFHNLRYGGSAYRDKLAELEREIGGFGSLPVDQLLETYRSPEDCLCLLKYKAATEFFYRRGDHARLMSLYLEGVEFFLRTRLDPFLGRLLDFASSRNALVVLFGDHGEEYDEEARGHFDTVNDGVIRVPMVFHGRGIEPGIHEDTVRSIDLAPTIHGLQNWPPPVPLDGAGLEDPLAGGKATGGRLSFAQTYVADTAAFMEVQQHVLNGDLQARPLRHVLYRDAVWQGDRRLVRQLHDYENRLSFHNLHAIPPRLALERRSADGGWYPDQDGAAVDDLALALQRYNRTRRPAPPPRALPAEIRDELRSSGYRV